MCAERYTGIINDFLFVLRIHGRLNSIEYRHWFDEYRSLLHHTARADFDFSFHFVSFHLFASFFIVITRTHTHPSWRSYCTFLNRFWFNSSNIFVWFCNWLWLWFIILCVCFVYHFHSLMKIVCLINTHAQALMKQSF